MNNNIKLEIDRFLDNVCIVRLTETMTIKAPENNTNNI